ncbi:MAG: DUF1343 domain-containing protein [Lachnospiraceae bacterium]|nr:DUF1343 domain-containing protein [Lachnospiraceae bacterium]
MKTILGLDRIEEKKALFEGKRIGLITNYSGVDSLWRLNVDIFAGLGFTIAKLFTPEHGMYGAVAGEKVEDGVYPKYQIPILSLYGEKRKPSCEDFEGLDLLVYDIQDVGLRYYTFLYTMIYCMETASRCGLPFVVLDRPNPLGGEQILGGRMQKELGCFVGDYELPVRYGLTCGELGRYYRKYAGLDLDYTVIALENYTRGTRYPDTGLLWNTPSPALPDYESVICYSGGCFMEATNISEGRGTPRPFQIYGAPWMNMDELYERLSGQRNRKDFALRKRSFVPAMGKYRGELCFGVEFAPLSVKADFIPEALSLIRTVKQLYPEQFELRGFERENHMRALTGSQKAEEYLDGELELDELMEEWSREAEEFAEESEECRIYR